MLRLGLGLGFGAARKGGAGSWTPADLFAGGAQGGWYEAAPSALWQDTAGTTPVTAAGDPVGRLTDLSGNGHDLVAASDTARPVYQVTGGVGRIEFDGVDDWSVSTPLLDLGQSWTHVGAWRADATSVRAFTMASNSRAGLFCAATNYAWYDATGALTQMIFCTPTAPNLLSVAMNGTTSVTGYLAGVLDQTFAPYDYSADTEGLAVGSADNTQPLKVFDGAMIGCGLWVAGVLSDADRQKAEAYVAARSGLTV